MNYNGKQIIKAVSRRLDEENVRCYDSAILEKISSLDRYELNQLIHFGDVAKWVRDRAEKLAEERIEK